MKIPLLNTERYLLCTENNRWLLLSSEDFNNTKKAKEKWIILDVYFK